MTVVASALPTLTLLVAALLSVLPWGLGENVRFLLPTLPFVVVHFWSRDRAELLPLPVVFGVTLAMDVLTFGPLGYWPVVYLAGLGAGAAIDRLLGRLDGIADWLAFAVVAGCMCGLAWAVASAYFASRADPWPMLVAAAALVAAWPLAVLVLSPAERLLAGPRVLSLDRRR